MACKRVTLVVDEIAICGVVRQAINGRIGGVSKYTPQPFLRLMILITRSDNLIDAPKMERRSCGRQGFTSQFAWIPVQKRG